MFYSDRIRNSSLGQILRIMRLVVHWLTTCKTEPPRTSERLQTQTPSPHAIDPKPVHDDRTTLPRNTRSRRRTNRSFNHHLHPPDLCMRGAL
ncbi:hypothetical protein M758_5G118200 [Ceratodon purpureus]|nr:hypothetical protein M758_5G118200 [Ceratodon purpureus]